MKKHIAIIFLGFLLLSCSNEVDLNGNWAILEMVHNGQSIYPNSISKEIEIDFNVEGYEGAEKLTFKKIDSTVILPGFDCEKMIGKFKFQSEKVIIDIPEQNQYSNDQFGLAKKILVGEFEIIKYPNKNILGLRSSSTGIKMANEKYLLEERINRLMN